MKKLDKANIESVVALTPLQEGMLFHYLKEPGSDRYIEQLALEISGPLDKRCVEQTWQQLVTDNEMLRTLFRWEELKAPVQVVLKRHKPDIRYIRLAPDKDQKDVEEWINNIKQRDRKEIFDLNRVPFRVTICKLRENSQLMLISNHHILYDGWSTGILLTQLMEKMEQVCKGIIPQPKQKTKFKEYVKWIQGRDKTQQQHFWTQYLEGMETGSHLQLKRKETLPEEDKPTENPEAGIYRMVLDPEIKAQLDRAVKKENVTPAALLYTAWGLLLQHYNNTGDVLFGTTVSGRSARLKGIEEQVGLFINTLPLRMQNTPGETLTAQFRKIHRQLKERETVESTSLVDIAGWIDRGGDDLFDTLMVIENYPLNRRLMKENPLFSVKNYWMTERTHYDLTVTLIHWEDIKIELTYNRQEFNHRTIARIPQHFSALLRQLTEEGGKTISSVDILSDAEKKQILEQFNTEGSLEEVHQTIDQLFEAQVERFPRRTAILSDTAQPALTYDELDRKAAQLAMQLAQYSISNGRIVGLMAEPGEGLFVGVLGILKAGGAYLPIDPDYPENRIRYMMADSNAPVMVTTSKSAAKADALRHNKSKNDTGDTGATNEKIEYRKENKIENKIENEIEFEIEFEILCTDAAPTDSPVPGPVTGPVKDQRRNNNLAYVIYTSGSTGKPKGVLVEHRAVVNTLTALQQYYPLQETDVYLQKTSFTFDVSVTELFGWILGGGAVALLDKDGRRDPYKILDAVEKYRVTHINFVPSMFNVFVEILSRENIDKLSTLRYIFLAGEAMQPEMLRKFRNKDAHIRLENLYGPTEAAIYASKYSLSCWKGQGGIPIGRPIPNTELFIMDRYHNPQPVGVPGELCIAGAGLARGYLNKPEITASQFVDNHRLSGMGKNTGDDLSAGNRRTMAPDVIYKTGDLARWQEDGNIEFLGRIDHQVKIRGFRVEVGEIQERLQAHKNIKEAVVVAGEKEAGDRYLCAYIVYNEENIEENIDENIEENICKKNDDVVDETVDEVTNDKVESKYEPTHAQENRTEELEEYLAQVLPNYMIPQYFVLLEKLPLGPSGKIDTRALPEPRRQTYGPNTPPQNPLEIQLAEIYADILGIKDIKNSETGIGVQDNFFRLGGHSLKATLLSTRIHKTFGVRISVSEIFENPTIHKQAELIRKVQTAAGTCTAADTIMETSEDKSFYPLSPAQKRLYLMHEMAPGSTAYNMPFLLELEMDLDKKRVEEIFRQIIQRHQTLRTSFEMQGEQPVQRIHPDVTFRVEEIFIEKEALKGNEGEKKIGTMGSRLKKIISDFVRPFDLTRPPLVRVARVTPENEIQKPFLLVDMNHIISDGTSWGIIVREFEALAKKRQLPPVKIQYKDYAQWQNRRLRDSDMAEHKAYWKEKLKAPLPVLNMPTDKPRPETRKDDGAIYTFSLGTELTRQMKRYMHKTGTTLYMILMAAYTVLLSRYSGQEDIIVGSPIAGRYHPDMENIVGLVVGSVLMRNHPNPFKTFKQYLEEVKKNTLEAYDHQEYPFESILEEIDWEDQPGRNPITDISLIVHNMVDHDESKGVSVHTIDNHSNARVDITLNAVEKAGDIVLMFEYATALFESETIHRMAERLRILINDALKNPAKDLGQLAVISEQEQKKVIGKAVTLYNLSHPQKRIYFTEKVYPGTSANTLAFQVKYNKAINTALMQQAVNQVLHKNDALRIRITQFPMLAEPCQYFEQFNSDEPYRLEVIDFENTPSGTGKEDVGDNVEERAKRWIENDIREPMTLINQPLYRFIYIKTGKNDGLLYMKLHHIINDGWTAFQLGQEITAIYLKLKEGRTVHFTPNPSYIDFLSYERAYLRSGKARVDREYWLQALQPLPEEVQPAENPPHRGSINSIDNIEAKVEILPFPDELRNRILEYTKNHKSSIYKQVQAAMAIYIQRQTGQSDIVLGSANHNRNTKEQRETAGMFVSTIPLRINVEERLSFRQLVEKTGNQTNYIIKNHQRYPFDLLMEEIRQRTGIDPTYLLNINLIGHTDLNEEHFRWEYCFPGCDPTPLSIHINCNNRNVDGILELFWIYQVNYFTAEEIKRKHRALVNILNDALQHPEKEICKIESVSREEREEILYHFNTPYQNTRDSQGRPETPAHLVIEEQAERRPDRVALIASGCTLTYRELTERARCLAARLIERGAGPGTIVAVKLIPSVEMAVSLLGILTAGAAYLPIDPQFPRNRIDFILRDSNAKIVVENSGDQNPPPEKISNEPDNNSRNRGPNPEDAILSDLNHMDFENGDSMPGVGVRRSNILPMTPAYIIYTSGTTGRPKGVLVEHRNLAAYLCAFEREFELTQDDVVIQQASFTFDAFVEELYPVLRKGGKLFIPERNAIKEPKLLADRIIRENVTMITASPLLLNELNKDGRPLPVRIYISGGDVLKAHYVDRLMKPKHTAAVVYNTYGPTETTVCATYYRCTAGESTGVPIGKPIHGYNVYVMDSNARLLPVGMAGELTIGGYGVAAGYINRPELTTEKFIDNPYLPGQRIYRSGDRVRWKPDGNIEYLGRTDRQIKVRGYRIEPGEIEKRLVAHPAITDAEVMEDDNTLVAYLVTEESKDNSASREHQVGNVKMFLAKRLPDYMVPTRLLFIPRIPRTTQGKVDRKKLKRLNTGEMAAGTDYIPPVTEEEKQLQTVWREVLGQEKISVEENFFELGGHSLKAVAMLSKIQMVFNREVRLSELYGSPTIRELAAIIAAKQSPGIITAAHGKTGGREPQGIRFEPAAEKEFYPLAPAQKRMYVLEQMGEKSIAYNISKIVIIKNQLQMERLENAFNTIISRHESLRTSFLRVKGEPVQKIANPEDIEFSIEKIELEPDQLQLETIKKKIGEAIRPFELTKAPLLRIRLIKTGKPGWDYLLIVDMHHIIADGVSIATLMRELIETYIGNRKLPTLNLQYKDYSEWLNKRIHDGEIKKQEAYWLETFSGEIPVLNLPYDRIPPSIRRYDGAKHHYRITPEETAGVKRMALQYETTPFTVLLAVYNVLLSRLTGMEDIVVGIPTAGRRHTELESIIGMFVNTLAIRNYPVAGKNYRQFLKEVGTNSLKAFENQEYPFEDLVNRVVQDRDTSRNPIFDTMMTYQDKAMAVDTESPQQNTTLKLEIEPYDYENVISKFDISLIVQEGEDSFNMAMEYSTLLFKPETIQRYVTHFKHLLTSFLDNPEQQLIRAQLMSPGEKQKIVQQFNRTTADYPADKTIHQVFREQVERIPDRIAVIGKTAGKKHHFGEVTYRELNRRANRLARRLTQNGTETETVVAFNAERTVESIIAILGIMKAGGAYLPIDPDYPRDRVDYMLKDSNAQLYLTQKEIVEISGAIIPGESETSFKQSRGNASNACYVIYTSGSTGKPKGVMAEHRNVINLVKAQERDLGIHQTDRILQLASISFDASVEQINEALLTGAVLVMVERDIIMTEERFADYILKQSVTQISAVPTFLSTIKKGSYPALKRIVSGGDTCSRQLVENWGKNIFINEYGPTETTVTALKWKAENNTDQHPRVPVGKPLDNTTIYILDKEMQPVPIGVPGQMFIGGHGVTRGYINRVQLTMETFIPNPFKHGECLYDSGDMGRWYPDGTVDFLGRADGQVKIRGFRIELGEIETCLKIYDDIYEAVVINVKENSGREYLAAYFRAGKQLDISNIRNYLSGNLPEYMVPGYIKQLEKIPITPNGKIDRTKLPKPGESNETQWVAPKSDREKMIAQIWKNTLNVETVGAETNFFEMGGNSIDVIKINSRLKETINIDVPVVMMFRYPTVRSLAEYIQKMESNNSEENQIMERREEQREGKNRMARLRKKKRGN